MPSLEKLLSYISDSSKHIKVLMNLLRGWSIMEDYGIPVGTAPARLLAEVAISKVDEALLANGVKFVRYVDDFRIFASSRTEAYRYLALMTEILKVNHFEVQSEKTDILPIKSYEEAFSRKKRSQEENAELLAPIYENTNIDIATNKEKNTALSNQIVQLFRKQLNSEHEKSDLSVVRTGLRSLRKLRDDSIVNEILDDDNLVLILPAFRDIIKYLQNLELTLSFKRAEEIGGLILELVEDSIISELEYYRIWSLELFATSDRWGNHKKLINLLGADLEISRRQLILALGIAKQQDWLRHIKLRKLSNEPPWSRRALLAAARCLPDDIREHWFKSVELQLGDVLDKAVTKWAMDNPLPK